MPVVETMSLIDTLAAMTKVHVAGVIANRVYDDVTTPDDRALLREVLVALDTRDTELARDLRAIGEVARLSAERRENAEEHLGSLSAYLGRNGLQLTVVPELRVAASKINESLAGALAGELT